MWKFLVSVELQNGKRFEAELETASGVLCIVQAKTENARCLAVHDDGAKIVKQLTEDHLLFADVQCVQVTLLAEGEEKPPARTLFVAAKIRDRSAIWSTFVACPQSAVLLREQTIRRPNRAPDPSLPQGVVVCDAQDLPHAIVGDRPTPFAALESLAVEIER